MKFNHSLILFICLLLPIVGFASKPLPNSNNDDMRFDSSGELTIPLLEYNRLMAQAKNKKPAALMAYALSEAQVKVQVENRDGYNSAEVILHFTVQVYEDKWTLIPVLSTSVALLQAQVNNNPVALLSQQQGLYWTTDKAGTYSMQLRYRVDAISDQQGNKILPIQLASKAVSSQLTFILPGDKHEVSIIPAKGIKKQVLQNYTQIEAIIPATSGLHISWHSPKQEGYIISRAHYQGKVQDDDAVLWRAEYQLEAFSDAQLAVRLLPQYMILTNVLVDNKEAIVWLKEGYMHTFINGVGKHRITLLFQVNIENKAGLPEVALNILAVPVSHFELRLPGKKEINVSPKASIEQKITEQYTLANTYVPMSKKVVFNWSEAVPAEVKDALQAHASVYHALYAEEGVLHGQAQILYEVTRGETSMIQIMMPYHTQINRIRLAQGSVTDWRIEKEDKTNNTRLISIFLDRKMQGSFIVDVFYETLLSKTEKKQVPLLYVLNVHRQRGMLALLSGAELSLRPVTHKNIAKVGENQLPAAFHSTLSMPVAHTYKYTKNPLLTVQAIAPERKQGTFSAQVDTLISIADATLKGHASLEINVKSGSLMALQLQLPMGVNVLSLSSPALRIYQVKEHSQGQFVDIEFTREMQGQFRVEVSYERILAEQEDTQVPTIEVQGAQVEHGRIAIEALAAVEVQTASMQQLSSIDVNELPQQLILKTANPILLAYRYVHLPYQLHLKVTRHKELAVQNATIEQAQYETLFTDSGLAVTTIEYFIKNSRKQFLRLQLPENSTVWSVFVGGKREKPAQAEEGKQILIKMMNSSQGFSVEIIYASQIATWDKKGNIVATLPRPDIIVTRSIWDVYLPEGIFYQHLETNMDILQEGNIVSREQLQQRFRQPNSKTNNTLHINVPTQGVHYKFEKLYANTNKEEVGFELAYLSEDAQLWGQRLGYIAVLFLLLVIVAISFSLARQWIVILFGIAGLGLFYSIFFLGAIIMPLMITLFSALGGIIVITVIRYMWRKRSLRR